MLKKVSTLVIIAMLTGMLSGCDGSGEAEKTTSAQSTASASSTVNTTAAAVKTIYDGTKSVEENISAYLKAMTLEEKVGQMLQVERRSISLDDVKNSFIGSVFSAGGSAPDENNLAEWRKMIRQFKEAAAQTRLGIPLIYAVDAVHGNNNMMDAVIIPHNIGLGAAGDTQLMGKIAAATAKELKATGVDWTFAPCVAVSGDIRWGRSYECFGADPMLVRNMSLPYIVELQRNDVIACAKHFVADGAVKYGTGDSAYLLDQGNAELSNEELEKNLFAYRAAVSAGVKTIMVSYSSVNNKKNHGNADLIQKTLKKDLNFNGLVISDFEGVHQLPGEDEYTKVVSAVNAGVDILMEADQWKTCYQAIIDAVAKKEISEDRINDAVTRILRVKLEMGKFSSRPVSSQDYTLRNEENVKLAEEAVAKSLVLLKNKNNILPLNNRKNIAVIGPAADNIGIQCGGWTKTWQGGLDEGNERWMKGTTILDGFKEMAAKTGANIITDATKLDSADVIVAVLGEHPYAEGKGDEEDLAWYKGLSSEGNEPAIKAALAAKKPVVVILVSGRPRIVASVIDKWDGFVEAWLPGTEGRAVARVLFGEQDFTGKLPLAWPKSNEQLPLSYTDGGKDALFPYGYGLSMKK